MSEEKKEKKIQYKLVEVPASYGLAIQTPEEKVLTTEQAIVEILNKLDKVQKALA